ncbi:MAG: late competence development ComFB family protein, partial [Clostridiales bacterium]
MAKLKNDSAKDLLLNKLLPALNDNPFSSTYEGTYSQRPDANASKATVDPLSALRSKLFARSDAYTQDSFATINVMENLVLKYIDQVIRRFNACSCDRCRCDVAAYALNYLPPKYIVADPQR